MYLCIDLLLIFLCSLCLLNLINSVLTKGFLNRCVIPNSHFNQCRAIIWIPRKIAIHEITVFNFLLRT